ncbi:hypothetical protein ACSBOB_20985 [Mesorhizobium sp. ASY16-5R]|uniref:hypothetical protein n=1 Tax=Mesorhizobium sp. ASY16-5R TaxID=3445772 RepID=UPI003F9FE2D2
MPAEKRTPEQSFGFMFEALISGQQRTVTHLGQMLTKISEVTTEMVKLNRNQIQLRSEMGDVRSGMAEIHADMAEVRASIAQLRADMDRRFDAVDHRFDAVERRFEAILVRLEEIDNGVDQHSRELHEVRVEVVGQYNEILNALQAGNSARVDINEINARLDELERRAGLK